MYAVLRTLNKPSQNYYFGRSGEIKMEGINQSQVDATQIILLPKACAVSSSGSGHLYGGRNPRFGNSQIAIQAAPTGHLILSTIHTNSASGTIRVFVYGSKTILLAPALNSVIGQRLVRKICQHCQEEDKLSAEHMERVVKNLEVLPEVEKKNIDLKKLKFYKGKGCEQCKRFGL